MGQKRYLNDRGLKILAAMDQVSAAHGATNAQIALAWLIAQPGVTAPIVSATSLAQLSDILGAVKVKLTAEDLAVLDKASAVEAGAA
jgi:aryl-alcohol dehydrogenase-like predicted oxidoreductase